MWSGLVTLTNCAWWVIIYIYLYTHLEDLSTFISTYVSDKHLNSHSSDTCQLCSQVCFSMSLFHLSNWDSMIPWSSGPNPLCLSWLLSLASHSVHLQILLSLPQNDYLVTSHHLQNTTLFQATCLGCLDSLDDLSDSLPVYPSTCSNTLVSLVKIQVRWHSWPLGTFLQLLWLFIIDSLP